MSAVPLHAHRTSVERDELLDAQDLARWFKISERQVHRLPIPRLRLGKKKLARWRRADVERWLAQQVGAA